MGFTSEVSDFEEYLKFLIEVNLEDVSWMNRNQFVEHSRLLTTKIYLLCLRFWFNGHLNTGNMYFRGKILGFGRYLELWSYYNFEHKLHLAAYMKETINNLYSPEIYLKLHKSD